MKHLALIWAAVLLACASALGADWTAYNDCIGVSGAFPDNTAANATKYYPGVTGVLKDFDTGWLVPASVQVAVSNVQYTGSGAALEFAAGTDAYNMFHGKVDVTNGVIYYGSTGDWNVDLIFSGLAPTASYEVGTTFDRGSYSNRWSEVSITGADSYTYAASAGAFKVAEDAVRMVSNNTALGYVARWTDVKPGADGSFTIRHTYDPSGPGQDGNKAYGPGAVMLQQFNGPPLVQRVVIAQNHFLEQPYIPTGQEVGTVNWTPAAGDTELGFSTTYAEQAKTSGTRALGPYDSSSSPHRYRIRSFQADVVFDTVDISLYKDVEVSLDILRSSGFEDTEYFRGVLSNGVDTIDLFRLDPAGLNALTENTWYTVTATVPDTWTSLSLTVSGMNNSSTCAETFNFDNLKITGSPVPEPGTLVMLLGAAVLGLVAWRRRRK